MVARRAWVVEAHFLPPLRITHYALRITHWSSTSYEQYLVRPLPAVAVDGVEGPGEPGLEQEIEEAASGPVELAYLAAGDAVADQVARSEARLGGELFEGSPGVGVQ